MAEAESIQTTAINVEIETEAPYAKTIIHDILQELSQTLDFTGMYDGYVKVTSPSGELLYGWNLGDEAGEISKDE